MSAAALDRGRNEGLTSPLPPNRTGGFPASGFPVGGLVSEIGARLPRVRLRRSLPVAPAKHRSSASLVFGSCELFQHAFDPQPRFVALPCVARGTRGSCVCSSVSLLLPPPYPPSLHDRYSLPRYYEDSDSCPAPSSARTGILDSCSCTSRHSVSNHPMRPRLPAMLAAPGGLGLRLALDCYRRFFGLRSLLAVSSVASGRIEFVSQPTTWTAVLRTICSLPVALHPVSPRRSYFQLLAGSSTREGLPPSCARSLSSARVRPPLRRFS